MDAIHFIVLNKTVNIYNDFIKQASKICSEIRDSNTMWIEKAIKVRY